MIMNNELIEEQLRLIESTFHMKLDPAVMEQMEQLFGLSFYELYKYWGIRFARKAYNCAKTANEIKKQIL
jgi:hypothetical protein